MSVKSQENNMRRLANLLSKDLGYIWGERESGPNGAKKTFLNLGTRTSRFPNFGRKSPEDRRSSTSPSTPSPWRRPKPR